MANGLTQMTFALTSLPLALAVAVLERCAVLHREGDDFHRRRFARRQRARQDMPCDAPGSPARQA